MPSKPEPTIEELFEYLDSWYESKTPAELAAIRERQVRTEMTPMPVTLCNTCKQISLGWRLGCAVSDCPKQPVSVDIQHVHMNTHGQVLREGTDFCWIDNTPQEVSTDDPDSESSRSL